MTRHIPKAAPNTQRAAGKPCDDRQGQRARTTGWAAQAQDRGTGCSPGSGRNPQAQSLTYPPCAEHGRWELGPQLSPGLRPHRTVRPCGLSFV